MSKHAVQMVPKGYKPQGIKFSRALQQLNSDIAIDTNIISQATNFLASDESFAINDISRKTGISQLQNDFQQTQTIYNDLQSTFDLSGINTSNGLNTTTDIITRAESIFDKYEQIEGLANNIIEHFENTTDYITEMGDNISETVEQQFDKLKSTLENVSSVDVSTTLEKLPELIVENVLDLTIVNDSLIALKALDNSVGVLSLSILSLKAPTSLTAIKSLVTDLKSIINQIKQLQSQTTRFKNAIKQLQNIVKTGNYVSLALSLASGGITFLEHPPTYAAVYPNNAGYRTHGGHVIERDNTKGKERMTYKHPTGTSVAVHPDGSTNIKVKKDFQTFADGYIDINVGADATIVVKGTTKIIAQDAQIETSGNAMISSAGNCTINTDGNTNIITKSDAKISSACSTIITGNLGTEISTNGILTLSANEGIQLISPGFITAEAGTTYKETVTSDKTVLVGGAYEEKIIGKKSTEATEISEHGGIINSNATGAHVVRGNPIMLN